MQYFKYTFCIFLFFLVTNKSFSQRPLITDEQMVIEMVTNEMDAVFQSEDFLKKKNKKFTAINGKMVIDISVIQNGKVATFFKVESDIKNIDFINFMSNYILEHKFKFKLPKKQHYKIRYTVLF